MLVFVASCASANFFYNVLRGATADIGMLYVMRDLNNILQLNLPIFMM